MNTRGVLRLLLVAHARNRNVERAEQVKAELDANRFEYSGAMYAQLMEMYTAAGHLDKAMDIMAKAKSVDSAFIMDAYKVINLAALLVQKDKMTEAVALLDDFGRKNDRPLEFDAVERNFVRLLNAAADKGRRGGRPDAVGEDSGAGQGPADQSAVRPPSEGPFGEQRYSR